MTALAIHTPKAMSNGATAAAVTLAGSSRRLMIDVPGVSVTDVDPGWTRGFVMTRDEAPDGALARLSGAEALVREALAGWLERHAGELGGAGPGGAGLNGSVREVNGISILMFRNHPEEDLDYGVGSVRDFCLELRELRRGPKAAGFSMIWRAAGCREPPARVDAAAEEAAAVVEQEAEEAAAAAEREATEGMAAEEEAALLTRMRKKFAEDEARERSEEHARRAATAHQMKLVEKQSAERKVMYDKEKAQEEAFLAEGRKRDEYKKAVVAEARRKLLEEHAQKLAGYMPGGLLKNKDDQEVWQEVTRK